MKTVVTHHFSKMMLISLKLWLQWLVLLRCYMAMQLLVLTLLMSLLTATKLINMELSLLIMMQCTVLLIVQPMLVQVLSTTRQVQLMAKSLIYISMHLLFTMVLNSNHRITWRLRCKVLSTSNSLQSTTLATTLTHQVTLKALCTQILLSL